MIGIGIVSKVKYGVVLDLANKHHGGVPESCLGPFLTLSGMAPAQPVATGESVGG